LTFDKTTKSTTKVIAILVLVGEVYYYRSKAKKERQTMEKLKVAQFITKIKPLDGFDYYDKTTTTASTEAALATIFKSSNHNILLGHGDFMPVNSNKHRRLSLISRQLRD
jgi:hypothetical protein